MPTCTKCNDTGWYACDHNHKKVCDACCPHDKGWWELTDSYQGYKEGEDNRCCIRGCGTMLRDLEDE